MAVRVLLVDDNPAMAAAVRRALPEAEVLSSLSPVDASSATGCDAAIVDLVLGDGRHGLDVAREIARVCRVVVISGHQRPHGCEFPFLAKPFAAGELRRALGLTERAPSPIVSEVPVTLTSPASPSNILTAVFTLLIATLGYWAARNDTRIDDVAGEQQQVSKEVAEVRGLLRGQLSAIDKRLERIEDSLAEKRAP